ncbi:MAG: hypothetical protein RIQ79_169, partial [Verrucomicrobiota bacterium]
GETSSATDPAPKTPVAAAPSSGPIGADTPGGKIYLQVCAACHMPNGTGVSGMQPALAGSAIVAGDPDRLIDVVLKGPAAVLASDRQKFPLSMPPFGAVYNDADLAGILTFIRKNFAAGASDVTASQVAARRAK